MNNTIQKLIDFLYRETGVLIKNEKSFLFENRLSKRLRHLGLRDLDDYYSFMRSNVDEKEIFISIMTTHKTSFFREEKHFDFIKEWVSQSSKSKIHICSAACSTGEELYSLAIVHSKYNA